MTKNSLSKAEKYINKQKQDGDLIDFYSKEFISNNTTGYDIDDFLIIEKKYGNNFYGHMLILHLVDESDEAINELIDLYKPFENLLNANNIF